MNPLHEFFRQAVHWSLAGEMGLDDAAVEAYLADMLVRLTAMDGLYAVRDAEGRSVRGLAEMLMHGDVRFKADSFAREREVHRHVGDFLLFWSGLFPEHLGRLRVPLVDPVEQGRGSYAIAASFDHDPYAAEAAILGRLSREFETYRTGLSLVRQRFVSFG